MHRIDSHCAGIGASGGSITLGISRLASTYFADGVVAARVLSCYAVGGTNL